METIQEDLQENEVAPGVEPSMPAVPVLPRHSLPAKGTCWYCDKPVDSVRKFCSKDCSMAFDEEAAFALASETPAPAPLPAHQAWVEHHPEFGHNALVSGSQPSSD